MKKLFASALVLSFGFLLLSTSCEPKTKWPEIAVESVSVQKFFVSLKVGRTYTANDIEVVPLGAADPVLESDNTEVATVEGLVITAVNPGEANIVIKAGDKTCGIKVRVRK